MIISYENKIAYIGVPQTGSSFIHAHCRGVDGIFMEENHLKHAKASEAMCRGAMGYEFILFVRNHIDAMKSDWALMNRKAARGEDHLNSLTNEKWREKCLDFYHNKPSIDEFIQSKMINGQQRLFTHYVDRECHATYLKYENFKESCEILFGKLKLPVPDLAKRINYTKRTDLEITKETKDKIISNYREEMEMFGYL